MLFADFVVSEGFWSALASSAVFGVIGLVLLIIGYKLFDLLTPSLHFQDELKKGNMAVCPGRFRPFGIHRLHCLQRGPLMETPLFNKLSKEIGLVLISSSLLLSGCRKPPDDENEDDEHAPRHSTVWHGGGHGAYVPLVGRGGASQGGTTSTGSASTAGSARGGFGATGHAAAPGG